jgi:hypothetical protein
MNNLKLFVWHDVLADYTSGVMFALAENVEDAREAVLIGYHGKKLYEELKERNKLIGRTVWEDLQLEPNVYDSSVGFAVWGGG